MKKLGFVAMAVVFAITGCMTAPQSTEGRMEIKEKADNALAKAEKLDPTLALFVRDSYAYAVFPSVGKAGFVVGGAYGQGVLYEHGVFVGYCDMSQASVGFQLGAQKYTEIIVFAEKEPVDQFKDGAFTFAAQATAVALKSGVSANAKYASGVAVFTMDERGLMYEASVGGQKFNYQAK